ncbi:MAG: AzlC family ABC transporter permease [Peptoniphilus sp.]|nr:AzlC family ABC transporter permease [Peptoniphilus sp.]MDY3119127.1 AzlC family ABC transporter permease [Peptoniphilus sp.]
MNGVKKVFPRTLPIVISYFFLAIGFGVLVKSVGQPNRIGGLMSGGIYAGAMQFAMVSLFSEPLNVLELVILTVSINLRYLFYSLSLLGPLSKLPMYKRLLVVHFASDETFSLYVTGGEDGNMATGKDMFSMGLINFVTWVGATLLGGWIGAMLPVDATGVEFMMTALFITAFLEQWKGTDHHFPAIFGVAASVLSLLIVGPEKFILPSMLLILVGDLYYRRKYVH